MSNVGIFVTILYMTQYIIFFLQTVQDTYDSVYYFFEVDGSVLLLGLRLIV